jgi:hypothetical protein
MRSRHPVIVTASRIFVAGALLSLGAACDQGPPSPWKEMVLPLSNSTIQPGADDTRLKVIYRNTRNTADYLREYRSCVENAGYEFETYGTLHDPTSATHVLMFKKGGDRIKLTIQGGRDLSVSLKRTRE